MLIIFLCCIDMKVSMRHGKTVLMYLTGDHPFPRRLEFGFYRVHLRRHFVIAAVGGQKEIPHSSLRSQSLGISVDLLELT